MKDLTRNKRFNLQMNLLLIPVWIISINLFEKKAARFQCQSFRSTTKVSPVLSRESTKTPRFFRKLTFVLTNE